MSPLKLKYYNLNSSDEGFGKSDSVEYYYKVNMLEND